MRKETSTTTMIKKSKVTHITQYNQNNDILSIKVIFHVHNNNFPSVSVCLLCCLCIGMGIYGKYKYFPSHKYTLIICVD